MPENKKSGFDPYRSVKSVVKKTAAYGINLANLERPRRRGRHRDDTHGVFPRREVRGREADIVVGVVPAAQQRLARQGLEARDQHQLAIMLVEREVADLGIQLRERGGEIDLARGSARDARRGGDL